MSMMDKMMDFMMGRMSKEEKEAMMGRMMDKFFAEMTADDKSKLMAQMIREIRGNLKDFPGYAKIRRDIITLEPWSIDNGLLTPTLKVKRARVLDRFSDEISTLYASGR